MMSRFTHESQEALQKAQQIMFAKQHTQLDIEHVFLALLQQRNSLPAQIITKLGGDPQAMIRRLENSLSSTPAFTGTRVVSTGYITLRCNRVLQNAADEAARLQDDFISTGHLLLAIASEPGGTAADVLKKADIDYEKIKAALLEVRDDRREEFLQSAARQAHGKPESRIINPSSLARPVGFSHGILTTGGRLLFLAGQTSIDAAGEIVAPGDIVGQYKQVLLNLKAVVEEAGGEMTNIVKMTIFVGDRDNYIENLRSLGQVHKEIFGNYYPATALLEISRFFQEGVMIEIGGIAVLDD